ncbi:hypothetical protein [Phenylobacterium montanum]|uniref:DUF8021 domain-containing protein n=1 Tax=Phenylobacterium montanum TaxID=2823693 RepID=A0A975G444_9CAUL|nr:hypothetical protein [Caulobacter sp. S6]QUD90204.1 hypothetical protein KCG34_10245 [Caulobacter sp. S6]
MILSGFAGAEDTALRRLADRYLESVVRRDPTYAPLAPAARASLNAKPVPTDVLPEVIDFPALQIFMDSDQGGVVMLGVAMGTEGPRPYAVRLQVQDGRISEVETLLSSVTKGHFADVDQLFRPDVLYDAPVPPVRAVDRDRLRAIADSYWTGLQESDGSIPPFAYRCERFDNGKKITNNLSILLSPEAAVLTCASSLTATRPARPSPRSRRFPVLDVGLGVAASLVLVDFGPNTLGFPPMTHYMMAIFKVVDGEIRCIDEISEKLPFGAPSPW